MDGLVGIIVCDDHGIIKSASKAVCQLFLYPSSLSLVGKSVNILMDPTLRTEHDGFISRFFTREFEKGFKTTHRKVYGLKKNGRAIKIRISLSYLAEQRHVAALIEQVGGSSRSLFFFSHLTAHIVQVSDESFTLMCSLQGDVLAASGEDMEHITGYQPDDVIGRNVSLFCPSVLLLLSGTAVDYKVSHLVHASGRTVIVSIGRLEPVEGQPGVFRVTILEVDRSLEGVLTLSADKKHVLNASLACPSIFGYSVEELRAMSVASLFPNTELKKGKRTVVSTHKEGYLFYVRADMNRSNKQDAYTVIVRHKKMKQAVSAVSESDAPSDIIGWYTLEDQARLGKGTCGVVLHGVHKLSGVGVAIKVMSKSRYNELDLPFPPREIELMRNLEHEHICRLYNTIYETDKVYLITELAKDGDLFEYVHERGCLSEEESRHFFRQIITAVDYLHCQGIVHRDLKLENILLHKRQVKLIDVGLGNFFDRSGKELLTTFCGSPDFAAPELFERRPYYGPSVDIWSLGVILYLLSTPFVPFPTPSDTVALKYVWPKKPRRSDELKHLVSLIFQRADTRCPLAVIFNHPWTNEMGALPVLSRARVDGEEILDSTILELVADSEGMSIDHISNALRAKERNQITATYYLLLRAQRDKSIVEQPRRGSIRMNELENTN